MRFDQKLESWFEENKRDLPWRNTKNPYKIWLSEIMLQQTRVAQAIDYYYRFLERFPDVECLAKAEEQEVLRLWQGLGYYSRARNLHSAARFVCENLKGDFPHKYSEIIKLKGIGEYTAAAISSFAFDEIKPVLDGNVYRFVSRYMGNYELVNSPKGKNVIMEYLNNNISKNKPALFNQSIMEFGALQCTPKNPKCRDCIFQKDCYAYNNDKTLELPTKAKRISQRNRYFNYFIYTYQGDTFIIKREKNDIWKNLFEFPLIETSQRYSGDRLQRENPEYFSYTKTNRKTIEQKHILSHQIINAKFYFLELLEKYAFLSEYKRINWKEIDCFPFPQLIVNVLEDL